MRTLAETVRVNFFRILEIKQRLTAIQGMITQEKQSNLHKNNEYCDILICPMPMKPSPTPRKSWKTTATIKSGSAISWNSFKAPFPKKGHYWTGQILHVRLSVCKLTQSSQVQNISPERIVKTNQRQLLNITLKTK